VDVQALAGYAHKEEVVALVAQAVQDKERQMERRLGFAMLSTQVPRATAGAAAQADAERLLVVQADLIRQGGAIADLFQADKSPVPHATLCPLHLAPPRCLLTSGRGPCILYVGCTNADGRNARLGLAWALLSVVPRPCSRLPAQHGPRQRCASTERECRCVGWARKS
jgi:hypothetical protein